MLHIQILGVVPKSNCLVWLLNRDGIDVAVLDAQDLALGLRIVEALKLVQLSLEEDEVALLVWGHGMLLNEIGVDDIAQVFELFNVFF